MTVMTIIREHLTSVWKTADSAKVMTNPARRETEDQTKQECVATNVAQMIEGKTLVLLQVNCRNIYNKTLDFWNLIYKFNPDYVTGTEAWRKEEYFRVDYTTFRRDRHSRGGGEFICVKNIITCAEIWVDEVCDHC